MLAGLPREAEPDVAPGALRGRRNEISHSSLSILKDKQKRRKPAGAARYICFLAERGQAQ